MAEKTSARKFYKSLVWTKILFIHTDHFNGIIYETKTESNKEDKNSQLPMNCHIVDASMNSKKTFSARTNKLNLRLKYFVHCLDK